MLAGAIQEIKYLTTIRINNARIPCIKADAGELSWYCHIAIHGHCNTTYAMLKHFDKSALRCCEIAILQRAMERHLDATLFKDCKIAIPGICDTAAL